ncbi:hypothetical protein HP398_22085 [Brevibacillus sp. HB1.4B]|nr:hypothetical protein [Brevibacillus sp. HB1.4B]NTU28817.1 hypothetical protein [Brevibacillus sp. HB1.1]
MCGNAKQRRSRTQAGREIKFEVFDKTIPGNVEEAENNTPSGRLVPWHIVKDSDYLSIGNIYENPELLEVV